MRVNAYANREPECLSLGITFNNDTIKAMEGLGIRISSAALFSENNFNRGKDIFNYTAKQIASRNNDNSTSQDGTAADINPLVYHVPVMVSFKGYENSKPVRVPINNILSTVDDNIKKYGYSVIVFHPQDFMNTDESGSIQYESKRKPAKARKMYLVSD